MPDAGTQLLDELTGWAPEGGVVSVYVEIDPADRSEGWRIDLKNKLAGVDRGGGERVLARFPPDSPLPRGRTQVGFVELGGARREIWRGFQIASGETTVAQGDLPRLEPLMRILDDGWAVRGGRRLDRGRQGARMDAGRDRRARRMGARGDEPRLAREKGAPTRSDRRDRRQRIGTRPVRPAPRPQSGAIPETGGEPRRLPLRRSGLASAAGDRRGRSSEVADPRPRGAQPAGSTRSITI